VSLTISHETASHQSASVCDPAWLVIALVRLVRLHCAIRSDVGSVNPFPCREIRRCASSVRHKACWLVTSREAMAACVGELMSPENVTRRSTATIAGKPAMCWQHRLFGKQLARCNQVNDAKMSIDSAAVSLVHEDGWPVCEIIGMYFSFVNPGATCDDFTRQLVELYASVNGVTDNDDGNGGDKRKRFEVVHVVLWSNVTDVLDFEESFRAHVADLPWLAVPNRDYERKVKATFLLFFIFVLL